MAEREYRIEETLTIVGVGSVMAHSKAEAVEKASRGEVEFFWNDGQDIRRGDGIKAFVERPSRPGDGAVSD